MLEAAAFALWRRRTGRGPAGITPNLAAGACLLLAVEAALAGGSWPVLACLAAAGVAHVIDVRGRWR